METHNMSLSHKIIVHLKTSNRHLLLSIHLCTFTPTPVSCQLLNSPCTAVLIAAAVLGRTAPQQPLWHMSPAASWSQLPVMRLPRRPKCAGGSHYLSLLPLWQGADKTRKVWFHSGPLSASGRAESCTSFQIKILITIKSSRWTNSCSNSVTRKLLTTEVIGALSS